MKNNSIAFTRKSGYTESMRATGMPEGETGYGKDGGDWASGF